MNIKFSFLYAVKIFFSPRKSLERKNLYSALVCMALSLVPLVSVLVISEGMIGGITSRFINLYSSDLTVNVPSWTDSARSPSALEKTAELLSERDDVLYSAPEIQGSVLACSREFRTGAIVRGIKKDYYESNPKFSGLFDIIEGSWNLEEKNSCVIGQHISEVLGLHAGDTLKIISAGTKGKTIVPKLCVLKITGIVSCGYQELDSVWIFTSIEDAFNNISPSCRTFLLGIFTDCTFDKGLYDVQNSLYRFFAVNEQYSDFDIYTWQEVNAAEFENFASTRALLLVIMVVIVIVAGMNISSAIVMTVMERRKEIAILKSTGASSSEVAAAFIMLALICGLGGILMGFPAGLLFSCNINSILYGLEKAMNFVAGIVFALKGQTGNHIYILDPGFYLRSVPVIMPYKDLLVIFIVTLLLSVFAAFVPSIKAGKEKPLDTFRKS